MDPSGPPELSPPARPPFWLYPNLLALDAPVVAVVWQGFLAVRFGVSLPAPAVTSLFAAVWLVYLLDRLLDARRPDDFPTDRHGFARRNSTLLLAFAGVAAVVGVVSVVFLPVRYLVTGLIVAAVVGLYLLAVHRLWAGGVRYGAKEFAVGVVFAAGVSVPLIADAGSWGWWPAAVAFGLLCWWNCRLIDRWEVRPTAGRVVGRLIGAAAVLFGWFTPWPVRVAVATAAGLLLAVDLGVPVVGTRVARALIDAVLLTPLAVWALP